MRLVTRIVLDVPDAVAGAIAQEARKLLLGRRAYIRYLLAAAAAEIDSVRMCASNEDAHVVPAHEAERK